MTLTRDLDVRRSPVSVHDPKALFNATASSSPTRCLRTLSSEMTFSCAFKIPLIVWNLSKITSAVALLMPGMTHLQRRQTIVDQTTHGCRGRWHTGRGNLQHGKTDRAPDHFKPQLSWLCSGCAPLHWRRWLLSLGWRFDGLVRLLSTRARAVVVTSHDGDGGPARGAVNFAVVLSATVAHCEWRG